MASISGAAARDGGLAPLDQLEADVVGGLDEADARSARNLDRPFQQLRAQPLEPLDVGLQILGVEAEVLEAVMRPGVARAELLVRARPRCSPGCRPRSGSGRSGRRTRASRRRRS